MTKTQVLISKYPSPTSTFASEVNLFDELNFIVTGKYKTEVNACRLLYDSGDKIGYKKKKSSLPAVTFSGSFNGSHKKENLSRYSNYIIIDIDSIEKEKIEELKVIVFQDKYVCAIWISPSGCGLKILFRVQNGAEEHKKCYDVLLEYLEFTYNLSVDKSGSDICRLCFVSHDENLLIKEDAAIFNYIDHLKENISEDVNNIENKKQEKKFVSTKTYSERALFMATEGKNSPRNRTTVTKIIKFIKKNNISITANYFDWFRVCCAVANSFTYDLGQKYFLEICRQDGSLHDEYKSQNLLEYCYRNRRIGVVEFSTIVYLAKQKGFIVKRLPMLNGKPNVQECDATEA